MNSINIIKHEIRRLVFNKKYFYMTLILALFTSDILLRLVIHGEYGTAPFSKWSYSSFIAMISPMLMIILVLLCTSVFSEKEMKIRKIIYSTPITQMRYYIVKAASIYIAFILATLVPIIMSLIYYGILFKFYDYSTFIKPILFFLLPISILALGGCMFIGKLSIKLLYALIPFSFLNGLNLGFPVWVDLYGNNFLLDHGFRLWRNNITGFIPYDLPWNFMISRLLFICFGIILFGITCKKSEVI